MKDSRRIHGKQTISYEGYLSEVGVVPQDMIRVQRIPPAETDGQDNEKASIFSLLERILDKKNLNAAYKQVMRNKGSHGIDEMKVDELLPYLKEEGDKLIEVLKAGTYRPKPVR